MTQGHAPDPKCELSITFLTPPHPLHCLLCQGYYGHCIVTPGDRGRGKLGVGSFILWFRWGTRGWYHIFSIFCSDFVLSSILSWLVHGSLLCLFHCSFFAFFVSGSFN